MLVSYVNLAFLATLLAALSQQGVGLKLCWSCSYTITPTRLGNECLYAPWNVTTSNIVGCKHNCNSRVIYYRRQMINNEISSATRGCSALPGPVKIKTCKKSFFEETCEQSCEGEKCNTWSLYYAGPDIKSNGLMNSPHLMFIIMAKIVTSIF